MNGETTFLDEFNATAPDLSREVNVMIVGERGHRYSQNEQVVGTWIDGSTIYERVFTATSWAISSGDWTSTGISSSGMGNIIDARGISSGDKTCMQFNAYNDSGYVKLQACRTSTAWINVLILQYTKTTD